MSDDAHHEAPDTDAPLFMDLAQITATMPTAVPMVGTLSIRFDELSRRRAVLTLPDQPAYHNHVGGPHAGAMWTLAETASGAVVLANFGDRMAEATPLAVESTIRFRRLAMGDNTATAVMDRDPLEVIAELESGQRPEFTVDVTLSDPSGTQTGEMSIVWTLRPNRKDG